MADTVPPSFLHWKGGALGISGTVVVVVVLPAAVLVDVPPPDVVDVDGATVAGGAAVVVVVALGAGVDVAGAVVADVGAGAVVVVVGAVVDARWTMTVLGGTCEPEAATMPPIPPPMRTSSPITAALATPPVSLQNVLILPAYA